MLDLIDPSSAALRRLTRRSFLKAGTLGLAGASLSLADLLRARSGAAGQGRTDLPDRSVILIWLDGGPPQHETYDPKPDAPVEFRGPLKAMSTQVPGVQVSELLPDHARLMDKMSIIRSMHHDNGDHFAAAHWMLTGYLGSNVGEPAAAVSLGRLDRREAGGGQEAGNAGLCRAAQHPLGGAGAGLSWRRLSRRRLQPVRGRRRPEFRRLSGAQPRPALGSRLDAGPGPRGPARARSIAPAATSTRPGLMDGLDRFDQQAFTMVLGDAARAAFDIRKEDPRLRDRYGRHQWGQSALLARRLVEAGVRFVTLTFGGWDYHSSLESGMKSVLPVLDAAVGSLIEDLDDRGLLDSTMVLVMGEFGRTPRMNTTGVPGSDPVPGRDHWGNVMSVLAAGGGFARGRVVGASNSRGEVPKDRPVRPQDLLVTIYHQLGLSPETSVRQPQRPARDDRVRRAGDLRAARLISSRFWSDQAG